MRPRAARTGAAALPLLALALLSSASLLRVPWAFLFCRPSWHGGVEPRYTFRDRLPGRRGAVAPSLASAVGSEVAISATPTWDELLRAFPGNDEKAEPALTLYRDTNGWCPYCERVWIALHEKGIHFEEVFVDLFNKPQWYTDMVPTKLVPAVKFAASGDVVWESDVILRRLETEFPDTRQLFEPEGTVEAARQLTVRLINASFGLVYGASNLSLEEVADKRRILVDAIDELEDHIVAAGGPFLAGPNFTVADSTAAPMLERFAVQMPYSPADLRIRDQERWPALAGWYDAMETLPYYTDRIQGDRYSWMAAVSVFTRVFSGGNPQGPAADFAAKAEVATEQLLADLEANVKASSAPLLDFGSPEARAEAVEKLTRNHEAVVADSVNPEPKSQRELARLPEAKASTADATLRVVAAALLAGEDSLLLPPSTDALGAPVDAADVAATCRYVAARICVPRDMGSPAATALRAALLGLAHRCKASDE